MFIFWTVAWSCFFTVSGSRHLQLHSSVRNHCGIFLTVDVLQDLAFVCEVQSTIFFGEACGVNCGYFAAFQPSTSIVLQALWTVLGAGHKLTLWLWSTQVCNTRRKIFLSHQNFVVLESSLYSLRCRILGDACTMPYQLGNFGMVEEGLTNHLLHAALSCAGRTSKEARNATGPLMLGPTCVCKLRSLALQPWSVC